MSLVPPSSLRHRAAAGRSRLLDSPAFDPTGTLPIIRRFMLDAEGRVRRLRNLTRDFLVTQDYLGLASPSVQSIMASGATRIDTFAHWFGAATKAMLNDEGHWFAAYITNGYAKGARDAAARVGNQAKPNADKLLALIAANRHDLNGIVDATEQQVVRAVAEKLMLGSNSGQLYQAAVERIDAVAGPRLRAFANTSTVAAHASASLAEYRTVGITHVGVIAEHRPPGFLDSREKPTAREIGEAYRAERKLQQLEEVDILTAGDDEVCDECEEIAANGPYPINEAESLIPAHPNCRCAFVPTSDERFAGDQEVNDGQETNS